MRELRNVIEGGYSHSVSFDAAHIYNRTIGRVLSVASPGTIKLQMQNLHTISRCLTRYHPLSILHPRWSRRVAPSSPFAAPITSATHLKAYTYTTLHWNVTFNIYIVYMYIFFFCILKMGEFDISFRRGYSNGYSSFCAKLQQACYTCMTKYNLQWLWRVSFLRGV